MVGDGDLRFSRMPVYEGSIDHITGVVHARELLAAMLAQRGGEPVGNFVRPVDFIPASLAADGLLRHFQRTRNHLAIVAGEAGTVLGLVTLEDVLEELVGEIVDETDAPERARIEKIGKREVLAAADAAIAHINAALHTEVSETRVGEEIGERITDLLGRIPVVGDEIPLDDALVQVVEATPRAVQRVLIKRAD